jgi:4-hydroxyphenylacetate 3-monooxygenase
LIRAGGHLYLGVGSDHTDRDVERDSVADSKAACPKPIGRTIVPLPDSIDWDAVAARCEVDGRLYQEGTLRAIRIPTDVLALFEAAVGPVGDVVMFGGTLTLIGGEFVPGASWTMSLQAESGPSIGLDYRVVVDPRSDR